MSKDALARLLLVEDENALRGLVQQFLALEDFDVEPAVDGQQAIDAYTARGPYDLILMDLNLPYVPGVEACRQIKRMNHRQPILVCSAAILDSHTEALHALDIHDTLTKPYHPVELAATIRQMLVRGPSSTAMRATWRDDRAHVGPGRRVASLPSALSELRDME